MRAILLIIATTIIIFSCSEDKKTKKINDCINSFEFISCSDSIPVFILDISKNNDDIRNELKNLYGYDLCEECSWVDFKIPFIIEGKEGFLKVLVDFDCPVCDNCPIPIRLRQYFSIMTNSENQLIVNGEFIKIDSLGVKIDKYLQQVGQENVFPESFDQVTFLIIWSEKNSPEFIDSILTVLYKTHLAFVEKELLKEGEDFCSIDKNKLVQMRQKYPLRIELDIGKLEEIKLNMEQN